MRRAIWRGGDLLGLFVEQRDVNVPQDQSEVQAAGNSRVRAHRRSRKSGRDSEANPFFLGRKDSISRKELLLSLADFSISAMASSSSALGLESGCFSLHLETET